MSDLIRKLNTNTNAANSHRKPGQSVKDFELQNNGVYHTNLNEPVIQFNKAESEKIIQQKNSIIVMGRDRPMGITSGYGAQPSMALVLISLLVQLASKPRRLSPRPICLVLAQTVRGR